LLASLSQFGLTAVLPKIQPASFPQSRDWPLPFPANSSIASRALKDHFVYRYNGDEGSNEVDETPGQSIARTGSVVIRRGKKWTVFDIYVTYVNDSLVQMVLLSDK
jgi:hypothetical protein